MYNHDLKAIFIHIPKTAGLSIRNCLSNNGFYHKGHVSNFYTRDTTISTRHQPSKNLNKNCIDNYFKFCFVRNPWDIVVSSFLWWHGMYEWSKRTGRGHNRKKKIATEISEMTFHDFVKKYPHKINEVDHQNLGQHFWLEDETENKTVDFIGKFENLQEDFNIICDKIGIPKQQLSHKNATKRNHYTEYYNDETQEIVAKKYAKDIEYFGYKFGK